MVLNNEQMAEAVAEARAIIKAHSHGGVPRFQLNGH